MKQVNFKLKKNTFKMVEIILNFVKLILIYNI